MIKVIKRGILGGYGMETNVDSEWHTIRGGFFMGANKPKKTSQRTRGKKSQVGGNQNSKELEEKLKRKKLIIQKGDLDSKDDSIDQTF